MTKKYLLPGLLILAMLPSLLTGCSSASADTQTAAPEDSQTLSGPEPLAATEIQVFIAASLENAFKELIPLYNETQPDVKVTYNADSSGTLMTQIEEGYECDVFCSAAANKVEQLAKDGLMVDGSRVDLLSNELVLISAKGSGTKVTGLDTLNLASSIALADGSVPVGKYTRIALVNAGIVPKTDDPSSVTTAEIAEALGGAEINECSNVSKVKEAVKEGVNEVGTVYYSDAYSVQDSVDIIQHISSDLTGKIVYPICQVKNKEADEAQSAAADDFFQFLQSDAALAVFEKYMFVVSR